MRQKYEDDHLLPSKVNVKNSCGFPPPPVLVYDIALGHLTFTLVFKQQLNWQPLFTGMFSADV